MSTPETVEVTVNLPKPQEGYEWYVGGTDEIFADEPDRRELEWRFYLCRIPADRDTVTVTLPRGDAEFLASAAYRPRIVAEGVVAAACRAALAAAPATEICGVWMCKNDFHSRDSLCVDQGDGGGFFHDPANDPRWRCALPRYHDGPHAKEPEHAAR